MATAAGPSRRRPTLAEVAARAGVSMTVASRVINNAPHVSHDKRKAVEKAIRDLGYAPSRSARALATRKSGLVALAVSGDDPALFADPFFAHVIVGISAALEETDLHLLLCLAASGRSQARFQGLLGTRAVDGVMLLALRGDDPLAHIVERAGLPAVYGGRPLHGEPRWFVDADNRGGARKATEHLIGLGRTRIAAITGLPDTEVSEARDRGYRDAMAIAGLNPPAVAAGDFTVAGGAAAMTALLDAGADPDAVFVANDNMAAGAVRVLRERGRRVPDDVAVVGFDDLEIAARTDPPLTTVHQPVRVLGQEMARMLTALLSDREPSPLILPTRLVVRDSA
ncbi:LacI family DNA-binding transcriptional regulator [Dactylosporangium sp. NPDC049140]|uniref:LacI family DNA-binding transcriptional regulator n=1 Tax=Dactylosporangium sp. NPDC049140 TaxID=3155647 RepID=UPI0033DE1A48